jgi:hypothetical protein
MPQNQISPDAVQRINDFNSLLQFCGMKLGWDIDPDYEFDELTFDWRQDELNLSDEATRRLRGGVVRQLREFAPGQPWGVFFVEFATEKVYRASLRQILRALIPRQRARPDQPVWQHENLLFICATRDYQEFTFAHFRGAQAARSVLTTFGWRQGDTHLRTLCEHNLPALTLPRDTTDANGWLEAWRQAFDIEKVTGKFFAEYSVVFQQVEAQVRRGIPAAEQARLYTQRLFNRLMFIYFIQKKGWLSFQGDKNYLRAMYDEAMRRGENFKRERLYWLFFWGMSNVGEAREAHAAEVLRERRGDVPFLNGGLFDMEDEWDGNRDAVPLDNDDFAAILALFERYNFTVEESTPLDVQVAVDPEMLGKVFEELVTGRHESGSYYTPRPIVSFMCREALKHYLKNVEQVVNLFPDSPSKNVEQAASLFPDRLAACRTPDVEQAASLFPDSAPKNVEQAASLFPDRLAACRTDAIARFVDEGDAGELSDPESVLEALRRVKVCDPACGSGAYLLGMLQELMRLRAALFQSKRLDAASLYERKRSIIENNLYGVDKDPFAVQIACLRLWLSLAIEADEPQPLPNLDFKIGCGDSLLAPAPSESEKQMTFGRGALVAEYRRAKGDYVRCNNHEQKARLRERIAELRTEIALALHHQTPRAGDSQIKSKQSRLNVLEQNLATARNPSIAAQLQKEADKIRRTLHEWQQAAARPDERIFDWAVEFAEVFMPETQETSLLDEPPMLFEDSRPQAALIEQAPQAQTGGFDIILANPPYVDQRLLERSYKDTKLKPVFREVYNGTADLYVYFFGRANQLLKRNGVGVFISSNKWLLADYGEKLRQHLLDAKMFHWIIDFGDQPVFKATAYPCIFVWQNQPRDSASTLLALVSDLKHCYEEGIREHTARVAQTIPHAQFGAGKIRVSLRPNSNLREMLSKGQPLRDFISDGIYRGIITGLNEAFIINREVRDYLISEDSKNSEIIKPMLAGEGIRRYEVCFGEQYLIWTFVGVPINLYPAVFEHLKGYQSKAEVRCDKGQYWWELRSCAYYDAFNEPKIIYPQIMMYARFYMDEAKFFLTQKCFMIPRADWYLLGVLNSSLIWDYIKEGSPTLRGGYSELRSEFVLNMPIPDAPAGEREAVARLAQQTQELHTQRRGRVEQFLGECGTSPAASSSRNPLEQPWTLTAADFAKRARHADPARDETAALTERLAAVEREIDQRIAALYGVPLAHTDMVSRFSLRHFDNDIRKEYDRLPACRSGGEQAGTRNHFAAISPTGWQPVVLSYVVIKFTFMAGLSGRCFSPLGRTTRRIV